MIFNVKRGQQNAGRVKVLMLLGLLRSAISNLMILITLPFSQRLAKILFLTGVVAQLCSGCDPTFLSQHPDGVRAVGKAGSQSIRNDTSTHDPTNDRMEGAIATAWREFIKEGRYRWATESDFRFPAWAKQRYSHDIERAAKTPIQAGRIKGSYNSTEVALIVVDTSRDDSNRYGVVIFSGRRNQERDCEMKWLLRDQDLSRVSLNWSSGDTLGIAEYRVDGSYWNCFVRWNAKSNAHVCDLKRRM